MEPKTVEQTWGISPDQSGDQSTDASNGFRMLRTLLFIPHEIAGLSVFGFGWVLVAIGFAFTARMVFASQHVESVGTLLKSELPVWGLMMAVVAFVLPSVELRNIDGEPLGIAIRGYGVMLLLAIVSSVGLAFHRAKKLGIDPEIILSMAPWLIGGGILGARAFYVIQYWDHFRADTLGQTIRNLAAFTEGGLVVYGAFIGGFFAAVWFIVRHRLPLLRFGDVIVPSLFIGVFFGRLGCLFNGCCYGGRCEEAPYAIHFPPNSPVYERQLQSGELLGLSIDPTTSQIKTVAPGSLGDRASLKSGQHVERIVLMSPAAEVAPRDVPVEEIPIGVSTLVDGTVHRFEPAQLPKRALPVYPAQIVSSVDGLLLCLLLSLIPRGRFPVGFVMMSGIAGYAVLRFFEEEMRVDEAGQFGTSLSIAQWVSIVILVLSVAGFAIVFRNQKLTAQPQISS
jgi:phosphatidylglycerol:prolipoprotein diacylglycerol transferase